MFPYFNQKSFVIKNLNAINKLLSNEDFFRKNFQGPGQVTIFVAI